MVSKRRREREMVKKERSKMKKGIKKESNNFVINRKRM